MPKFIDLRAYDGPETIEADICIVGAGAAGITLARELGSGPRSVVLLESGGMELEGATQFLYNGTQTGVRYFDLSACRLRYFGGTTNHWGGWTFYNSELDFEGRPELGLPGWPFPYDELVPYLERAAELLEIDFDRYDPARNAEAAGFDPALLIEQQADIFRSTTYQQTPRKLFAPEFRRDLEERRNLRVFLNANVTYVQLEPSGNAVDHLVTRTLEGKRVTVRAKAHVLACHAIENARLLLASNDVQGGGIGNTSDMLGRNFMDHIHVAHGQLIPGAEALPGLYYRSYGALPRFVLSVPDETRRREELTSYSMGFKAQYPDDRLYRSMRYLKKSFFRPYERQVGDAIRTVVSDLGTAARLAPAGLGLREREILHFSLDQNCYQAPNPNSRITLLPERDALGVPKVNLHWELSELDLHSLNRGQELVVRELSALGFGRFAVEPLTMDVLRENVVGHYHHLGTTRMAATAREGVVDADCRVHEVANLYVAGSSTFPVAGRSGPTFSIVAMAMRLANHLDRSVPA